VGVLQVINRQEGVFTPNDLELAMAFADRVATVIS
jgi:GAF domain-containing protein